MPRAIVQKDRAEWVKWAIRFAQENPDEYTEGTGSTERNSFVSLLMERQVPTVG